MAPTFWNFSNLLRKKSDNYINQRRKKVEKVDTYLIMIYFLFGIKFLPISVCKQLFCLFVLFVFSVYMSSSIKKEVLFKTFDVNVQVQNVPELWRQMFWKVLFFLWNVTYIRHFRYLKPDWSGQTPLCKVVHKTMDK